MKDHEGLDARLIDWLLEGEPGIRWQVMADLLDAPRDEVAAERARVGTEGIGARILGLQNPDGGWGIPNPTGFSETPEGSATYALGMLMGLGLDPGSEEAKRAVGRVREGVTFSPEFNSNPFFAGEVEACINGRILAIGAYFGEGDARLAERLLGEQLKDGGWNCEAPPSVRGSFHSTLCVLEGLTAFRQAKGTSPRLEEALARGQAYLLERRMIRRLSTGEIVDPDWTHLGYPVGWRYDVLRGLDHLRVAGLEPDERVEEAVAMVEANRLSDGRWPLQAAYGDDLHLDLGERLGEPDRWVTLRALRVLRWARGEA